MFYVFSLMALGTFMMLMGGFALHNEQAFTNIAMQSGWSDDYLRQVIRLCLLLGAFLDSAGMYLFSKLR